TGARPSPQLTVGLAGVKQLDLSHRTACAVDDMNRLFCWGNNRGSQATASMSSALQLFAPTQVTL
ncbi:MAG: hypothetical protein H0T79_24200, partial [Deltaproteobacteria bacterium]|nr:hypothetical protein [Deltaproteobacteria bacterium]